MGQAGCTGYSWVEPGQLDLAKPMLAHKPSAAEPLAAEVVSPRFVGDRLGMAAAVEPK